MVGVANRTIIGKTLDSRLASNAVGKKIEE